MVDRVLQSKVQASDLYRSRTAIITSHAYHARKSRSKFLSGMPRPSLTLVDIEPFNPSSLREEIEQSHWRSNKYTCSENKHVTSAQSSLSAPFIPLNDLNGLEVSLESFSNMLLQVRLADTKKSLVGEHHRVPLSLHIAMIDVEGNPDLYIVTDRKADELGMPSKDHHLWESKRDVMIHPDNPEFTTGTYILRVVSGIEQCKCRIRAETKLYIPTIDNARLGPGHGYRPSSSQKKNDFGNLVFASALGTANRRRLLGRMGRDPFQGRGFSISNMVKPPHRSSDSQPGKDTSTANALDKSEMTGHSAESQGGSGGVGFMPETLFRTQAGESAFNHALEVSCRSSLGRIRFGKITPIRDVTVRDFFSVLNPDRAKEPAHALPAFSEQRPGDAVKDDSKASEKREAGREAGQEASLRPSDEKLAALPPPYPGVKRLSVSSTKAEAPHKRRGSQNCEFAPTACPGQGSKKAPNLGTLLMELLAAADVSRNTVDRFRKPLTDCLTVYVPVAQISGFGVMSSDGLIKRKVVALEEGRITSISKGEAVSLQAGALVPLNCDCVIAFSMSRMIEKDSFVPTFPISKGVNMEFECSAFFEQFGSFVPALDYIKANFPSSVQDYENLRRKFTRSYSTRLESLPIEIEISVPQRRRTDLVQQREISALVVASVDCSNSPLFRCLHAEERSLLAYGAKVHVITQGSVIAREGELIKYVGQPTRSILMLMKGAVSEGGSGNETAKNYDRETGLEILGTVKVHDKQGYVIGSASMFCDEPWPADIVANCTCTLAEFTMTLFCPMIMSRPEILDSLDNSADHLPTKKQTLQSENHHCFLGESGMVEHSLPKDQCALQSFSVLDTNKQQRMEKRLSDFLTFLKFDPLQAIAVRRWWEEEKWNDRLIALGAVDEQEKSMIYDKRKKYQENQELKAVCLI
uniref:Cyclic nucleotide-binding domain-containing protein n=1 Tax=Cryptomonas curvata TaxID=233186 RepID=A0A7S0LXL6_9CRYP|mmetsp:Transcript_15221/g.32504  ORF Transcript_15221/g.32504 Transcript_15221/m.32504 type:complete len:922 (+) Transcript_15221:186-2951(+)